MATKDYKVIITDQQNEYTFSAKKKNAIYVKGIKQDDIDTNSFRIDGDNLLFSAKGKDFVVSNYTGIKYIKTDNALGKTELLDIISHSLVDNTANVISTYNKKYTVTGATNYNDEIDMSGINNLTKTIKDGKKKQIVDKTSQDSGFIIKSGAGDDIITGSMYSDTITGGVGTNVINYSKNSGNDTIILTKNEDLTLNLKGLSRDDLSFNVVKKNLVISYIDDNNETQKLTLKNFGTKDVVGSNGKVTLSFDNGDDDVDLKTDLYLDGIKVAKNYTGTYHSEEINAEDYQLYKTVKVGKTKVKEENNEVSSKGLTIKGGAGNDVITGSKYSDKIYGNDGDDTIYSGTGNDIIDGGAGTNVFIFNLGDGKDIIYMGKSEDTLQFKGDDISSITFEQGNKKNNKDLIIKYSDTDQVTVKNYYTVDKKGNITGLNNKNSVKHLSLKFAENTTFYYERNLTNNDLIIKYDNEKTLTLKDYFTNNVYSIADINSNLISELIDNNLNEIYDFANGCAISEITSNGGTDTLKFTDGTDLIYEKNSQNSDLIVRYGDKSVTLKNYFAGGHSITNINGTDIETLINGHLNEIYDFKNGCNISEITSNGGTDTLKFADGTNLTYEKNSQNSDLVIKYNDKSVTLKDFFDNSHSVTNINGILINDLILNNLNEIYDYANGCTVETITSNGGVDSLKFASDVTYVHDVNNNDLIINYGENKSVTIKEYFAGEHSAQFINGTAIETIIENNVNEIYDYTNGCEISEITSNGGVDSLKFAGNLTFTHDVNNNDLVINYAENKSVTVLNYFKGNHSVRKINGTVIDDVILNNTNEIYDFENGCTISEIISNGGIDTLKFEQGTILTYERNMLNSDLIIKYDDSSVTLKNYFNNTHSVVNINGISINSLINNNLNEIYDYASGCRISEITSNGGIDKIIIPNLENAVFERDVNSNDLTVYYLGNYNFKLKNYFGDANYTNISINNETIGSLIINNLNEIYNYTNGCTITEITSNGGTDTLKFADLSNLIYTKNNNDLIITYDTNKEVTVKEYFNNNHSVQKINNTLLSTAYENGYKRIIVSNETENVSGFEEVIVTNTGSVTNEILGGNEDNKINIEGAANKITTGNGIDTITISGTVNGTINTGLKKDVITVEETGSAYAICADQGNNVINVYGSVRSIMGGTPFGTAGVGSDTITVYSGGEVYNIGGNDGADKITIKSSGTVNNINSSTGDDTITIEQGANVGYISCSNNQGNDIVYLNAETNNLRFMEIYTEKGITKTTELSFVLYNDSLVIKYNRNKDSITIKNYDYYNDDVKINIQYYMKGSTTLSGGYSGNTLLSFDIKTFIQNQVQNLSQSNLLSMNSLQLSNLNIDALNSQITSFTSQNMSDISVEYNNTDTSDVTTLIAEYTSNSFEM